MKINDKVLILKSIKKHYNFAKDGDFAEFLGIGQTTLSSWYARNTLNWDIIFAKCENLDFNKLLKDGAAQDNVSSDFELNEPATRYGECNLCAAKDKLIDRLEKQLDRQEKEIERLTRQASAEDAHSGKRNSA